MGFDGKGELSPNLIFSPLLSPRVFKGFSHKVLESKRPSTVRAGSHQVLQITVYIFRRRASAICNFLECYLKPVIDVLNNARAR